jgi:hypothetical protein
MPHALNLVPPEVRSRHYCHITALLRVSIYFHKNIRRWLQGNCAFFCEMNVAGMENSSGPSWLILDMQAPMHAYYYYYQMVIRILSSRA